MQDEVIVSFPCCFCGGARDTDDPITVVASWAEDGEERWQAWGAHRACLIERLAPETLDYGGPIFGPDA